MNNDIKIPIKNIYYMLSYAWNLWNIIDEDNDKKEIFGDEKFDNIYNVMAYILNMFLDKLIKRGFYKGYITLGEDLSVLKGKIDFSKSVKRNTINYKKLVCSYNILSNDILFNQIIKSTLNKLINYKNIDNDILEKLIRLNHYFIKIKNINVNNSTFKLLKYNRNNMHYKIIINICKFIHKHLIVNKNSDEYSFIDFNEEKRMHMLYEKFVLNFYKMHFRNDRNIKVKNKSINWQINNNEYIPIMKTDTMIYNKEKCLIIDTKFYKNILIKNNDKISIRSSHLYQMFSYMSNVNKKFKTIKCVLLYPLCSDNINKEYKIQDKYFAVNTLDLNSDFDIIQEQLINIVKDYF
ncbi:5-methylcytosine-specific restriction endonuclease system specificity protein McrC [Brachyspira hyodysenteriae]|uniref:5-methylcytosine-specific restriction endonuclease system specificity protein McrC n=1 Tax=Brachyspira hyodysenteriae TaxID=159 RepID=UPI00063DBDBE|nr:5-methylcytosine-specific restriction endonuclease system specificity protein McrC [Brachyspira hyodysenteriae]KLI23713.1 restriction endonuclease [Brachyspira hyodysenteriae]MCZ9961787.1 5-methylcytosine-specific restriction endonuclease system specificity protein McrC [Brachyspira hyodysenteriae]TVL56197.1 5-methylcytosine-specific restriction endonuclease system specificity protein McrC [Brachyspira hyodysenteriae]TVL56724.1 5-methylcytosine-specific restriction endonuclease system specif